MDLIKKYHAYISLISSFILIGLLWLSVAMDSSVLRLITTVYIIIYLLMGKWFKKMKTNDSSENQ